MRYAILVLLLCSCTGRVYVEAGASDGEIGDRSATSVGTSSQSLRVGYSMPIGEERRAYRNLANAAILKKSRFDDLGRFYTTPPDTPAPAPPQDDEDESAEDEGEHGVVPPIDNPPDTYEKAWSSAIFYGFLAVAAAAAMFAAHRWGVPAAKAYRATRPKDGEKNTNGDSRDD